MGGLGHFAVLWAVALGAEVTVLSHSPGKREDALSMGAKNFVVTSDEKWFEPYSFYFDWILNCADATHKFNLQDYFSTMKVMKLPSFAVDLPAFILTLLSGDGTIPQCGPRRRASAKDDGPGLCRQRMLHRRLSHR